MSATQWFYNEKSGQRFDLDVDNLEGIKLAKLHGAVECDPPDAEPTDQVDPVIDTGKPDRPRKGDRPHDATKTSS